MSITVNGELISDQAVEAEMQAMQPYYNRLQGELGQKEKQQQLREWACENLIEQVLFRQLADKFSNEIDPSQVDSIFDDMCQQADSPEQYLEQAGLTEQQLRADIVKSLELEKLRASITDPVAPATPEQMLEYYNDNKELFIQPAMADADQIVIAIDSNTSSKAAKDEIESLAKKLSQGRSFDDIMKNNSDAGLEDGRLGWFTPGEMLPEFDQVVFKSKPGEISKPFKTEIGWHIVRVNKITPESVMPFDEVQDHIAEHLQVELQEQALADFIDAEKEKAQIIR